MNDSELAEIADEQIDWIADKLEISRETGRLALLSVLMGVRDSCSAAPELLAACQALLNAPHRDHFASRLGDEEMDALNLIKALVAKAEASS